ncbi:Lactamase_B domain-containing protein [Cephalotus follicularis]|uniref:Lactamase_B domain-containing protein n=1 Tax=Cephalotus follicularis TaxID=3775 RepID=A0A1Q3BCU9_CEPFO|nr:Lactamase_B domain-containing protein [Cephalotus follicularis]
MATCNLALILNNPLNDTEFILLKQTTPPKFNDQEYDSYVDLDLWDLPCTQLYILEGESFSTISIEGAESYSDKLDLRKFDVESALDQVLEKVGLRVTDGGEWRYWRFVEEPEFGPGSPVHTVYIMGKLVAGDHTLKESCTWISIKSCLDLLLEVKPNDKRVGPSVVVGLLSESLQSGCPGVPPTLHGQEYPPGVTLVPMRSKTAKPFLTTNLIVFAPRNVSDDWGDYRCAVNGDALIVDPGCQSQFHEELMKVVAALPRKLIVFVTHHHRDHVDGLSVIQKGNPEAILLAHENTMRRIRKDDWSLGYTSVSGAENICIGGQRLSVIFAPGHTDGHMALLHVSTNSLIVGDHCVGQGSAVLDITSGGNMTDYFQSTYKFMELSPHVLIPMHGRINLWPKHMLCGYLKNRRSREASILKAIENGAETLFDIVAYVYSNVDRSFWIPASSNVRLHVEHLAQQDKLPKEFLIQNFQRTCGLHFLIRWTWAYISISFPLKYQKPKKSKLLIGGAVVGLAVLYSVKSKLGSKLDM